MEGKSRIVGSMAGFRALRCHSLTLADGATMPLIRVMSVVRVHEGPPNHDYQRVSQFSPSQGMLPRPIPFRSKIWEEGRFRGTQKAGDITSSLCVTSAGLDSGLFSEG